MEIITKTNAMLSNIFDVNPTTGEIIDHPSDDENVPKGDEFNSDFELARETMHRLMLQGISSMENASIIANGSEDPKSFDAVSNLIGKISDVTDRLISLHKKKQEIISKVVPAVPTVAAEPGQVTNMNGPVFFGTTSEMSKMLFDSSRINKASATNNTEKE